LCGNDWGYADVEGELAEGSPPDGHEAVDTHAEGSEGSHASGASHVPAEDYESRADNVRKRKSEKDHGSDSNDHGRRESPIMYVSMFNCFQLTLHHTEPINEVDDNNFSDEKTFEILQTTYHESLGRLRQWKNKLTLRTLKRIFKLEVQT
jgi:hypothetical protein